MNNVIPFPNTPAFSDEEVCWVLGEHVFCSDITEGQALAFWSF